MTDLRPITPINIAGLDIGAPENVEPICELVDPASLFVDPSYQRNISERGLRRIRQMIEAWDWNRFSPPSCSFAEHDGQTVLKVFDGQHTSIAAASHPGIAQIPVMIHEARETAKQAAAFVGQNTGRLAVSKLQIHQAGLVAGDPEALTLNAVCERANVRMLAMPPSRGIYKPRDTVAVAAIETVISRCGVEKAVEIMTVASDGKLVPITADHIRAVEYLMTNEDYCEAFEPADLSTAIELAGRELEKEAKLFASGQGVPYWKGLAVQWFKKCRMRRSKAA